VYIIFQIKLNYSSATEMASRYTALPVDELCETGLCRKSCPVAYKYWSPRPSRYSLASHQTAPVKAWHDAIATVTLLHTVLTYLLKSAIDKAPWIFNSFAIDHVANYTNEAVRPAVRPTKYAVPLQVVSYINIFRTLLVVWQIWNI